MNALPRIAASALFPVLALTLALSLAACKPEAEKKSAAAPAAEMTDPIATETPAAEAPAPATEAAPAETPAPVTEAAPSEAAPPETAAPAAATDAAAAVPVFLSTLQAAVAADNRAAVAALVRYPLTTYDNGVATAEYADAAALLAAYDALFTPAVKDAIARATPETLFTNIDGVMIGNGEIWIDNSSLPLMIKTINAQPQN